MAWLTGYSYRKKVTITGQGGAGTDYQVKLDIGDSAGGDFHLEGNCVSFPDDIRFTDNDETTELKYWIKDTAADPIEVWVKVTDDLGSNVDIYVYYGKAADTTTSNGFDTFIVFDDFADGDYTTNKEWTVASGTWSAADFYLKKTADDGSWQYIYTGQPGANACFNFTFKLKDTATYQRHNVFFMSNNTAPHGDDDYMFNIIADADWLQFYKTVNGSPSQLGDTKSWTADTDPHDVKITRTSAGVFKVYLDEVEITEFAVTDTNLTSSTYLVVRSRDLHMEIDNLFVRKWQATEPAYSSAGGEETPSYTSPLPAFRNP